VYGQRNENIPAIRDEWILWFVYVGLKIVLDLNGFWLI
jgi:hypothetical protein